jgi:hypothetical protein
VTPVTPVTSEASDLVADITRDDIEREKRNLNLDGFIQRLSVSGNLTDVSLIGR